MLPKAFHVFAAIALVFCVLVYVGQCGPVPKVNEHMPKIPQWHCLRYFKHDLLMMRRCRHLRVPTMPRLGDVKK